MLEKQPWNLYLIRILYLTCTHVATVALGSCLLLSFFVFNFSIVKFQDDFNPRILAIFVLKSIHPVKILLQPSSGNLLASDALERCACRICLRESSMADPWLDGVPGIEVSEMFFPSFLGRQRHQQYHLILISSNAWNMKHADLIFLSFRWHWLKTGSLIGNQEASGFFVAEGNPRLVAP